MTVIELINKLSDMPHNANVWIMDDGYPVEPDPEMVWNDRLSKWDVIL